jgi:hypothetical protein
MSEFSPDSAFHDRRPIHAALQKALARAAWSILRG